jgi:predicted transcriptional regulator
VASFAGIDAPGLFEGVFTMSTLTLRLPDDVASRLKNMAETRFKLMAAETNIPAALAVLDRLDKD